MAKSEKKKLLAQIAAIKRSLTGERPAETARSQMQMVHTCEEIGREVKTERDARLVRLGYRLHGLQQQAHWDAFYAAFVAYRNKEIASKSSSPATPILRALAKEYPDNQTALEYLNGEPQVGPVRVYKRRDRFLFEDAETGKSSRPVKETSIMTQLSRYRRRPN